MTGDIDVALPRKAQPEFVAARSAGVIAGLGTIPLLVFAYGLFLAVSSLKGFPPGLDSGRWLPFLADKPIGEDGFYMLMASWHLGTIGRLVANFDEPVSGIQPLATLLYAALALLTKQLMGTDAESRWWFLRTVLVLNTTLFLAFCGVMRSLAMRLFAPNLRVAAGWFAAAIAATSFYLFRAFTYGLETGLYLLLLALSLQAWLKIRERRSATAIARFGCLLGLTMLARIDFCVVAAIALPVALFMRLIPFIEAAAVSALAGLLLSPWIAWVYLQTGSFAPSSGPAQSAVITLSSAAPRLAAAGGAVLQVFSPTVPLFGMRGPAIVSAGLVLFAVAWNLLRRRRGSELPVVSSFDPDTLRSLVPWCAALLALPLIYTTFFWAAHFYSRYFAPLALGGILLWAGFLARMGHDGPLPERSLRLGAGFALVLVFAASAAFSLHGGRVGNSHAVTAGVVNRQMHSGRVGAFQSGAVGFFNSNVENLDGKVNFHVLPFVLKGDVTPYLEMHRMDWIVDWPDYIHRYISADFLRRNYMPCEFSIPNGMSVCFRARLPPAMYP